VIHLKLDWHEFNVNLDLFAAYCKGVSPLCCGVSANSALEVHFTADPGQEILDEIQAAWSSLTEESSEAAAYKSASQIRAEAAASKAAKLASAAAKLEALGLTADEIAAITGG
jgi:hypothetical protein